MSFRPMSPHRTKVYFSSCTPLHSNLKSILSVYQKSPCVALGSVHDPCMIALPLSSIIMDLHLVNGDMHQNPQGD
jgi:hypothetical protein